VTGFVAYTAKLARAARAEVFPHDRGRAAGLGFAAAGTAAREDRSGKRGSKAHAKILAQETNEGKAHL